MSNPMLGDTVWFYPGLEDELAHFDRPLAATVVRVPDEGDESNSVNLVVFDPDGTVWARVGVPPRQEDQPQGFEEKPKTAWLAPASPAKKKRK